MAPQRPRLPTQRNRQPRDDDLENLEDSTSPRYKLLFKPTTGEKDNAFKEILTHWKVEEPITYGEMVAKAIHKPYQVMGWDPVEYGFHWTNRYTTEQLIAHRNRKREENNNYFPLWSINRDKECPNNANLYGTMRREFEAYMKKNNSEKVQKKLSFDGDRKVELPFSAWGDELAGGLFFVRNMKYEHPDWSNKKCWDEAVKVLQEEITCKNELQTYWSKHLKTKRFSKALGDLTKLKDINNNTETKLTLLRESILPGLGIKVCLDDRKNFDKIVKWAKAIPTSDQHTRKKAAFITKMTLNPLPEEIEKEQEKEAAEEEKRAKAAQKELDKKKKLHARPATPVEGDVYFNDEGVMVLWCGGEEIVDDELELPYIPACKRKPSMFSQPENPVVGDLYYDEHGNLVRQEFADDKETGYVIVSENDVVDVSKIIGKPPTKQIQKAVAPSKKQTRAMLTSSTEPIQTRKKARVDWVEVWDADLGQVVIDVDKIGDVNVETEQLQAKQKELTEDISTMATEFESELKKLPAIVKQAKTPRGAMAFVCEDDDWKKFNNWLVDKIYMIMNDVASNYGAKFKIGTYKGKHEAAMQCAEKCGFIPEKTEVICTKQDLEKWAATWMNPFNVSSFYDRLAALEEWIGPYYSSKEASSKRYGYVQLAAARLGLTPEEKSTILTVFITIADWPVTTSA